MPTIRTDIPDTIASRTALKFGDPIISNLSSKSDKDVALLQLADDGKIITIKLEGQGSTSSSSLKMRFLDVYGSSYTDTPITRMADKSLKAEFTVFSPGAMFLEVSGTSAGNYSLSATAAPAVINGTETDDLIFGSRVSSLINGLGGDDRIHGSWYSDTINGGAGNDNLTGALGDDVLNGGSGNDKLSGDDGNDRLFGGDGNDSLEGGAGNDTLSGGAGNDIIIGGEGSDTADFSGSAPIRVDLRVTSVQDTGRGRDRLLSIESVNGGSGNDSIVGNSAANTLRGAAGNDTLVASGGNDTLFGGEGNDRIDGGDGVDTVVFTTRASLNVNLANGIAIGEGRDTLLRIENVTGGSGNDILVGNNLSNTLRGSAGNDTLIGGSGNDTLFGGQGHDRIDGGNGVDTVAFNTHAALRVNLANGTATGDGRDTLVRVENVIGGNGNDSVTGNNLANRLDGGAGNDTVIGGAGHDTLLGGAGDDRIDGGSGWDTVVFTTNAALRVNLAAGTATGEGRDTLVQIEHVTGGGGNDVLIGNNIANRLTGGAGNDRLIGAGGNDILTGGAGADRFEFADKNGADRILDFQDGLDRIVIGGVTTGFGDLRITASGNNSLIDWGHGTTITVEGVRPTQLSADDFIFT